jgi:hypothetical protein
VPDVAVAVAGIALAVALFNFVRTEIELRAMVKLLKSAEDKLAKVLRMATPEQEEHRG